MNNCRNVSRKNLYVFGSRELFGGISAHRWMANVMDMVFPIQFLIFFILYSADWDSSRGGHGDALNAGAGQRLVFGHNPVVGWALLHN